jgi:hypothetical protein
MLSAHLIDNAIMVVIILKSVNFMQILYKT